MQSSKFNQTFTLNGGLTYTFGNAWDEPSGYKNFNVMISSDKKSLITVFQDSESAPSQSSPNAIKRLSSTISANTQIFFGNITNRFISFTIKNLDSVQSNINFYVVYK